MPRRCRVCNRALKAARWRAVGLGPICARRLGLRLVAPRPTLVSTAPIRTEPVDDQMTLFDIAEKGAA